MNKFKEILLTWCIGIPLTYIVIKLGLIVMPKSDNILYTIVTVCMTILATILSKKYFKNDNKK